MSTIRNVLIYWLILDCLNKMPVKDAKKTNMIKQRKIAIQIIQYLCKRNGLGCWNWYTKTFIKTRRVTYENTNLEKKKLEYSLNSNDPNIRDPINNLDPICQSHDITYSKAQSLKDTHIAEYMPCMMKFQKYLMKVVHGELQLFRLWFQVEKTRSWWKVKKGKSRRVKVMLLTRDDSQRRFLVQNGITTLLIMRHFTARILLNVFWIRTL